MPNLVIMPTAIAYDLVLEDHILARQSVKRLQRPFSRELAEMVRYAVGYRSRAFVTFGAPIPLDGVDVHSRSDVWSSRSRCARAPAAVQGAADGGVRRGDAAVDHTSRSEDRVAALIDTLRAVHANLDVSSAAEAIDRGTEPLEARGILVIEGGRLRGRLY